MNLIELHILQSFPVTCLNRDDLGAPKTAYFGGCQRARVSSQSWKRPIRTLAKAESAGLFAGQRTRFLIRALEDAYKKGGVSLSILGVKMAKAMGEKGVLTDKDVTRYIQDPAAYSGSHAWLKKLSSGQLTDKVYRDLKRIIHSFDKNANKKIEKAEDKILTEFVQSREGKEKEMNIDDARKYLGIKKGQRMLDATKDKVDDRKIIKTQTSQSNPNKKKVFYSDGTSEVINVK